MTKLIIKNRYGVIPNAVLNSKKLTWLAKGLYGYIQSKPDNWDFSAERIKNDGVDGLYSIKSGLRELEAEYLLQRIKYKNDKGQWDWEYTLFEHTTKPPADNPPTGNQPTNKERSSKKEIITHDFSEKVVNKTKKPMSIRAYNEKEHQDDELLEVDLDTGDVTDKSARSKDAPDKTKRYKRMFFWLAKLTDNPNMRYTSQAKAIKGIFSMGTKNDPPYTENQAYLRARRLWEQKDGFYQRNGMDWWSVEKSFRKNPYEPENL